MVIISDHGLFVLMALLLQLYIIMACRFIMISFITLILEICKQLSNEGKYLTQILLM